MTAKGGQAHRADVLQWGRRAHYANSAAVSHDRARTRDALRLRLRWREDRPNVTVSQGRLNNSRRAAPRARDVVVVAANDARRENAPVDIREACAELNANLGANSDVSPNES